MSIEQAYLDAGKTVIIGVDEAGYGAWAGPVAAAAVCLPWDDTEALREALKGVKDSKQMTPRQRDNAYKNQIPQTALAHGIGHATPDEINAHGLAWALGKAFERAYMECAERLGEIEPQVLLIDGKSTWKSCPFTDEVHVQRVPDGDNLSLTIAAASVLAKVWRDRKLAELGEQYPAYGFERHKGYGTKAHQEALRSDGVIDGVHRRTYKRPA
ncbi:MAG: ribonuclease HII, partial [Chloroflexota bacterium]